jgi:hypothetical protein
MVYGSRMVKCHPIQAKKYTDKVQVGFVFVWFNVRQHNNGQINVSFWESKYQLRG